ncbi:MAG: hypothetical protein ACO289_11500 [Prochlorococcaceae cyanobacterium]
MTGAEGSGDSNLDPRWRAAFLSASHELVWMHSQVLRELQQQAGPGLSDALLQTLAPLVTQMAQQEANEAFLAMLRREQGSDREPVVNVDSEELPSVPERHPVPSPWLAP